MHNGVVNFARCDGSVVAISTSGDVAGWPQNNFQAACSYNDGANVDWNPLLLDIDVPAEGDHPRQSMARFLTIFIGFFLFLGLSGCGNKRPQPVDVNTAPPCQFCRPQGGHLRSPLFHPAPPRPSPRVGPDGISQIPSFRLSHVYIESTN